MTRIDDILKSIYRNRACLISPVNGQGLDFSGRYRIKFELWEVRIQRTEHILILHNNITFRQTIDRFIEKAKSLSLPISSLTVIRVDDGPVSEMIESVITSAYHGITVSQYSLQVFIQEYCIESSIDIDSGAWTEPFFVDQPIYALPPADPIDANGAAAIPFLTNLLTKPTSSSAHLIVADGGDGKSSLCSQLVYSIDRFNLAGKKQALLLSVEAIRDQIDPGLVRNSRISSLYDIYRLFRLVSRKETYIGRTDFEVRVFSGNLIVVLDGLDELVAVFQDRFDVVAFLTSMQELSVQLGDSHVLITSRGNVFRDIPDHLKNLDIYTLKGFGTEECRKYFEKRFGKDSHLSETSIRTVEKLIAQHKIPRIPPFMVDLIAELNESAACAATDEYTDLETSYPSNQSLTDKIIFHTLRREKTRQSLDISVEQIKHILCDIASEHGSHVSLEKFKEMIDIYYEKQAEHVYRGLKSSPLLAVIEGSVTYRYHFLYDYFVILFIMEGLYDSSCAEQTHRIQAYATLADGATTGYKDVLHFCQGNASELDYRDIFRRLRTACLREGTIACKKAISFFVHLYVDNHVSRMSKRDISQHLLDMFCDDGNVRCVRGFYIFGNMMPLDFSGRRVSDSGFFQYANFLKCEIGSSYFSSTTVDLESVDRTSAHFNITRETFDSTCNLGALSEYVSDANNASGVAETILRRFFREFFDGRNFQEVYYREMESSVGGGGGAKFLREALKQHVVYIDQNGEKCGVTRGSQKAVHNYLVNNRLDRKLAKILSAVRI